MSVYLTGKAVGCAWRFCFAGDKVEDCSLFVSLIGIGRLFFFSSSYFSSEPYFRRRLTLQVVF